MSTTELLQSKSDRESDDSMPSPEGDDFDWLDGGLNQNDASEDDIVDIEPDQEPKTLIRFEVDDQVLEDLGLPILPTGYGFIGGAARAVMQKVLFDEWAPIRDIDIAAFEEYDPDLDLADGLSEAYMPEDYAFGHGVASEQLNRYFRTRDLTINEVAVIDGEIIATNDCLRDLNYKIIGPTEEEQESHKSSVSPKITAKALLIESVFKEYYDEAWVVDADIDYCSVDDFHLALALNKAFEYGIKVAERFTARVEELGLARVSKDSNPYALAISLSGLTDFIFRGGKHAEIIGLGKASSAPADNYERFRYFDSVGNRLSSRKGAFSARDEI